MGLGWSWWRARVLAWPVKPLAMVTGQGWASDPSWAIKALQKGLLCLLPQELLKLTDFKGRQSELSALHMLRDYTQDGEISD